MVLFLVCEENHTGDNTRFLGLFSWLCGNWSSQTYFKLLGLYISSRLSRGIFRIPGPGVYPKCTCVPLVPACASALLTEQRGADVKRDCSGAVSPLSPTLQTVCSPALPLGNFQHGLCSVLTSPWLCRWSFACPAASGGGMHGFIWIHLSMACASCVLHLSTRAL